MERKPTEVICGTGSGKSVLAVGKALQESVQGKSVIIIQFLKGSELGELENLEKLDSMDVKIFRFEKQETYYNELSEEEKKEEQTNIRNGLNFARKVIATRECDFLVLDEILGVIEQGIATKEMIEEMLSQKDESMHIVMTGRNLPEWMRQFADYVTTLTTEETFAG